jgi:serine/threonine-protein kinase
LKVKLTVTAGPHAGKEYTFTGRDSFLVGRSRDAHFQLSYDDPYFSRRHFLIEVNPPRCRLLDLGSRNGVSVNGTRVKQRDLVDGDEVRAGHTTFRVAVEPPDPDALQTLDLPADPERTHDHVPSDPVASPQADRRKPVRPGQTTDPVRPADDGPRIPGYEILGEVGRGAMGVVFRATRLADATPAAVKVIVPAVGVSRKQVERFLREARILGSLAHPHVVRFIEAGDFSGRLFIAMELVEGEDVGKAVGRQGPLPVGLAVRVICQALTGLAHAHAAGYVHRDVKPSNLLLGGARGKRVVKLADFGLARAFEASRLSGLTLTGEVGGTPAFMPPEQVTHYREAKPAADQYAAAATLYYLLSGKYVFDAPPDAGGLLVKILTESPVPLRDRRADVPAGLAAVVHRALAREAADRYPDVSAFRTALTRYARTPPGR